MDPVILFGSLGKFVPAVRWFRVFPVSSSSCCWQSQRLFSWDHGWCTCDVEVCHVMLCLYCWALILHIFIWSGSPFGIIWCACYMNIASLLMMGRLIGFTTVIISNLVYYCLYVSWVHMRACDSSIAISTFFVSTSPPPPKSSTPQIVMDLGASLAYINRMKQPHHTRHP